MHERGVEQVAPDWIDERTRFLFKNTCCAIPTPVDKRIWPGSVLRLFTRVPSKWLRCHRHLMRSLETRRNLFPEKPWRMLDVCLMK